MLSGPESLFLSVSLSGQEPYLRLDSIELESNILSGSVKLVKIPSPVWFS